MSADDQKTDVLMALVAEMRLERRGGTRAMIGLLTVITLAVGIAVVFLGSRESSGIRAEAKFDAYMAVQQIVQQDTGRRLHSIERGWAFFLRRLDSGKIIIVDRETFDELQEIRDESESELTRATD